MVKNKDNIFRKWGFASKDEEAFQKIANICKEYYRTSQRQVHYVFTYPGPFCAMLLYLIHKV